MSKESEQLYCIESVEGEMFSIQEVVDLLNSLVEKNEQLRKENIEYKEIINFCTNEGDDALVQVIRENVKLQNELDKLKSYKLIDKGVNDE